MSGRVGLSTWFPDRPPTWGDVSMIGVGLVLLLTNVPLRRPLSWQAVGVGFVAVLLALGPGANTGLAASLGRWFRGIGIDGRMAVILLYCCALALLFAFVPLRLAFLMHAFLGGILANTLYAVAYVVWARVGRGWRVDQADTD
ncbi:hypothetical protein [Natrialba asiatica]|uniref:Uncharacterized protein n=1 Tax=Natrialba asiatica (strain ATCC 700177 / DSM 12278 / JCM 9576 / FERM P-10747 / NBRC 102637 / 172P1) TaxID=29540 RepID=M0B028_NATA1|nr:hypothetical protein [Natrialba asiatica]ELZ03917.1 hypothetical protein C481_05043 [Natrialba asiatica DSM 12278]